MLIPKLITANPRLSKVITLDAVVSHLVAIYSTTGLNSKQTANEDQKSNSSGSAGANSSDSAVSDFSLSSGSNNSSIIIITGSPEEKKINEEVTSSDEEACTDLMIKLLDALEIVKECIL